MKTYKFTLEGSFDVPDAATEVNDFVMRCIGFKLPDGSEISPYIAFEVRSPNGESKDVTHSDEMQAIGIENVDYSRAEFVLDERGE
jgi:hypothetical protein